MINWSWIGSPNYGYPDRVHGRNGFVPIAIVLHIAEGSIGACDSWFNHDDNFFSSTHYCVGKNGDVHQYVLEEDAAWGNGVVKNPTWALLQWANPNLYTISVEHEGHTGDPWTKEMFDADVELIESVARKWHIPLDSEHIIGHCRIDSVDRANCPGTGLPWERLFEALNKEYSGA